MTRLITVPSEDPAEPPERAAAGNRVSEAQSVERTSHQAA